MNIDVDFGHACHTHFDNADLAQAFIRTVTGDLPHYLFLRLVHEVWPHLDGLAAQLMLACGRTSI